MTVTGWSEALNENIRMRSAAAGSSERIESSLVRTSNAAFSASRSQLKSTVNCASSGRAVASDLLDAGQRRKRLLDRANDELFHLLGRRAGVGDGHLHSREGDVREVLEPQQLRRDQPDREHGQEHHHRRDGAVERETGVAHGEPQPVAGSAAASGAGVGGA